MRHVRLVPVLSLLMTVAAIVTLLPTALADKAGNQYLFEDAAQQDLEAEPENPHSLNYSATVHREPLRYSAMRGDEDWNARYKLWQESITYSSDVGAFAHGRRDVMYNAALIRYWAPQSLELLVAASIAHQGSDIKDRPFGTDLVEEVWREYINANASVGIAQLRPEEVVYWAPSLIGQDLLQPDVAVRVMTAKLSKANRYILQTYGRVSETDRLMLLALIQNTSTEVTMRRTIDFFFQDAGQDWSKMLASDEAETRDWREQLRLILVHVDWLISAGWEQPADLDRDLWSQIAFAK